MTEHIQEIKGKLEHEKMFYLFTFRLPYKLSDEQRSVVKKNLETAIVFSLPDKKYIKK